MSFNPEFIKPYCDHLDGLEQVYEVALKASQELPENSMFLETGTRSGGSALAVMQAILDSGKTNRWLFTVDPYGMKPYKQADEVVELDYGEDHYRRAMKVLADFALENKMNHVHFRLKSLEWMQKMSACEFWFDGRALTPNFGFAYLDGDHDTDTVTHEIMWLKRYNPRPIVVVDDAHYLKDELLKLGTVQDDRLFIGAEDVRGR